MPTTTGVPDDERRPSLPYIVVRHIIRTFVYTPLSAIALMMIAFPFGLAILAKPETKFAAYAILSIGGLSIYMGQLEALEDIDTEDVDLHWFEEFVYTFLSFIYYNLIILLTMIAALGLNSVGYVGIAAGVAFLIPPGDIWLGREYEKGLLYGMMWLAAVISSKGLETFDRLTKYVRIIVDILGSLHDVVPPFVSDLQLTRIGRRRVD